MTPNRSIPGHELHGRRHGSLRVRLSGTVGAAVLAVIFLSTLWDYGREYKQGLRNVRASLAEQAHALRLARDQLQAEAFADYVDAFCAKMNERISPGHHILVLNAQGAALANSHTHSGPEMTAALRASGGTQPVIRVGTHQAAQVRLPDRDGGLIIVAQYLDHVRGLLWRQLLWRLATAAAAAGTLILLVVAAMNHWVLRPLAFLRAAASSWARRDFAARATPAGPQDIRALAGEFNAMAGELHQHELDRTAELDMARRIQENLLPHEVPRVGGLGISAAYRPASHVAGDLYDIVPLDEDRTAIAILDVCGHGISAALLTGVVKMSLYHRLRGQDDLSQVVSLVNRDLRLCLSGGHFVTLCVGIWHSRRRDWVFCAAGHPGGVLRTAGQTRLLDSTGPLLGVLDEPGGWHVRRERLQPGDLLVLYSDGVTEAGAPGNKLGEQGLLRLVESCGDGGQDLPRTILAEVDAREPSAPSDDVTVVAIRVLGEAGRQEG